MVFTKVVDDGVIDEKGFFGCSFWVHLQGIPTLWMTENVGRLLGGKAGKVIAIESDEGKITGGKWLRVRVLTDVTKPLQQDC